MQKDQIIEGAIKAESRTITQSHNESLTDGFQPPKVFSLQREIELNPSFKKQSPILQFHKLDQESCDHIASKIFK